MLKKSISGKRTISEVLQPTDTIDDAQNMSFLSLK
jgi:hypothetical protein